MDTGETLLDACRRELKEETGLKDIELKQFYTFDDPARDPRERVISVTFYARLPEPLPLSAGDDASEAVSDQVDLASALPTCARQRRRDDVSHEEVRAVCVERDPREVGTVSNPREPVVEHDEIRISVSEPWQKKNRRSVSFRYS